MVAIFTDYWRQEMSDLEFISKLFTSSDFGDPQVMGDFLSRDFLSEFKPQFYDFSEEYKLNFNTSSVQEISEFFYLKYGIFLNGADTDSIWINNLADKINDLTMYLSRRKLNSYKKIFLNNSNKVPFLFYFACSLEEQNIKHGITRNLGDGKTIESTIGNRSNDFFNYLPGLYSFTAFGLEAIEFFTSAKLKSMKNVFPNLEYFEAENYFGFQIDDEDQPLETVIQIQKEIAKYLGQEYFFDRDLVGEVEFKPIPTILEKIR
jgi:hypothetical protein